MTAVDEIKQRIDIVDLISQHVTLKRAGRSFMALCPFHGERTPSFHVDPVRQSWHCFGACGTGGDIFGFVMKKDGCDFKEALRILAERAGVELETRRPPQEDQQRARIYETNEAAAAFFHSQLIESAGGEAARGYASTRQLSAEALERFQIGYAPNSWDALCSFLRTRDVSPEDAVAAGLAVERERGAYDRFRHRLMFAIRDERGRVAGFGGRLLPGEALGAGDVQPKYVNTPQSPVFDKSSILYALDLAKDSIRSEGRAVIVEGYMDAIAAHEHGFTNVVASMGTALTERQVQLLKRYTRNLIFALDADAAGGEATLRGVQVVESAADREHVPVPNWRGVIRQQEALAADIRVLALPAGHDPDDVIRSDASRWAQLVEQAKPVLDYLFDAAADRHDVRTPRGRSAAAAELLPMIAGVTDRVVQAHYLQRLALMTHTEESVLRLELRQPVRVRQANAGDSSDASTTPLRDKREEFCLALLFRYPELLAEGLGLEPELFGMSENRALFEHWVTSAGEGEIFEGSLTPDLRPQYERILSIDLPTYDTDRLLEALHSAARLIEQQRLRLAKRASMAALSDVGVDDSSRVTEMARTVWSAGGTVADQTPEDEAAPAAAFVEDMEAGKRVHEHAIARHRETERPAR